MKRTAAIALFLTLAACSGDDGTQGTSPAQDMGAQADVTQVNDSGPDAMLMADIGDVPDAAQADQATSVDVGSDTSTDAAAPTDMASNGVYQSSGDPYQPGALTVATDSLDGDDGAPKPFDLYYPTEAGTYPWVVFQHGFSLRNGYYSEILTHLASHGFVVVAPQMYEPSFFGAPSTAEEASDARVLYGWLETALPGLVPVELAASTGLAGHSRGAKVVWLALEAGETTDAAVGVDPVDGMGGPFGGEARVLDGGLSANVPSLFIGAARSSETIGGMACAPPGDDHAAFYAGAPAPTSHVVAADYGHLDMLNADKPGCGITCSACVSGPADDGMRRFSAGQLAAHFRVYLQGDTTAEAFLTDATLAPIDATFENRN